MKNIISIFKYDLKSVVRNMIVFVVIIGIAILPALYSWFNIASNWDPYSNTGELPFAFCTQDKGYTYKSLKINAGDLLVENLKQNNKMGWKFVSKKKALEGVKSGEYYAAVIVPKDFSADLFSITTGKFKQAKLQYYVNEKKNAIAPKITDKGSEAIEGAVNEAYVDKITEVIATALNLTETEISDSKVEAADNIIKILNNTKTDIDEFIKTNNLFISTLDATKKLLQANKDLGPGLKAALAKAGAMGFDIKESIQGFGALSPQISESVSAILNQSSDKIQEFDDELSGIFNSIDKDASGAADKLSKLTAINNKIIDFNNTVISVLTKIQTTFPDIKCDDLIKKLEKLNDRQNAIIKKINSACDTLRKTGKLPKDVQNEIKSEIAAAKSEIGSIKSSFSGIKSKLGNAVDEVYTALDDISEFITMISGGTGTISKLIDDGIETVDSLKATMKNLNDLLKNAKKKIDVLIGKVNEIKTSKKVENLITPIIENPEELGKFVSSPVGTDTHRIYPIENYGSAMTPFYTSLGLWVGGVVLVAVISVELTKREEKTLKKAKEYQVFFGRFLIFFMMGQIQALVISLGDLFFLKIQCENPLLFVVGSMISSFVYTLIIYALTITFSVLGKALAVIILVLQVAGSGGTFPIEVLPGLFKALAPFLPFRYGINMLREAVAGVDIGSYWMDVGYLMLFALAALFIGLVLRKPCVKIIDFFNKRVDESDLVI